jgi:hypothetical protein
VDGHPHAQGESGLALLNVAVTVVAALVGGDVELGVERVEDAFGVADGAARPCPYGRVRLRRFASPDPTHPDPCPLRQ